MRVKQNRWVNDSDELEMTPMIDIIFQLLMFFLLSAKFIALESQLASWLPKDKGLSSAPATQEITQVSLELAWEGSDDDGSVVCETFDYRDPRNGGARASLYRFGSVDGRDPFEYAGQQVKIGDAYFRGYIAPDFGEIEQYLSYRKSTFADPTGKGLPVTVNFDGKVPVQVVTMLLDICTRLDITNFTLTAKEKEIE